MNKTTIEELIEKQAWCLSEKVEHTKNRIKEFYEYTQGKCFIAFSGGIDSTILLHIARSVYPDIKAVFSNTTNEYPELIKFVKTFDNVEIVYPDMNFKKVIEKYGFPFVSKKVSRAVYKLRSPKDNTANLRHLFLKGVNRKGQKTPSYKLAKKWYFLLDKEATTFDITSICCDILKKKPMADYVKKNKLFPILGTLASESNQRKENYVKYGCNIYGSKEPKARPMSIWNDRDIWDYIKINNVNYCSLYDELVLKDGTVVKAEKTTGCVGCGMGCSLEEDNRFERLRLRNPKHFKNLMKIENNGVSFADAYNHTFNIEKKYKNKKYQEKVFEKGLQDLVGLDIEARKIGKAK